MGAAKFIKRLFIFIMPLAVCFILFEIKLRGIDNSYKAKKRYFEKDISSVETLILGNSHSYYGVDPKFLSFKGFNLANSTQSFFYDRALTYKYLSKLTNLKCVLIPISYFSFYFQMMDVAENWRDFAYEKFWGIRYPKLSYWDSRNYSYFMMYSPERSFNFLKTGFKESLATGVEPNGHFYMDTAGSNTVLNDAVAKVILKAHTNMIDFKKEKENIDELSSLIDTLQKRDVKVVLFTTPVAETYSKQCDPAILSRTAKIVERIVERYNCAYKNYFNDRRFSFSDFGNNDHLNFSGAEKFTRILDSELIRPLFSTKIK